MEPKGSIDISHDIKAKALAIGRVALEKQASDVAILEVGDLTSVADYFIFCSGSSERQVNAISEAIQDEIRRTFKDHPSVEGQSSGTWVLLDYGDLIVHIFHEQTRAYYGIENMWRDAKHIPQSEYDSAAANPSSVRPTPKRATLMYHAS